MDNYAINISVDKQIHHFEIGEYPHQSGESCKVKVFQESKLLASFQPDDYNPAHLPETWTAGRRTAAFISRSDRGAPPAWH